MKPNASNFKFKTRRYFSEEFKKQKVKEVVSKKATIREISRLYEIAPKVIYDWLHKYSPDHHKNVKIVYEMDSDSQKALFYKEKVAELERIIGQKQIEVDFLKKLIDLASEELGVDLKKNFSTRLSNGTVPTKNKPPSQ